ncbi:MAG: helix-turn-helix domain-containing protein [Clostridia bacterium]|nr:helix-turn-helix domain-containing protein [Clostridia bacterium]
MSNVLFRYQTDDLCAHYVYSDHPREESFPIHTHDMVEIYYFISGSCKYLVEGNEWILKPGDIMLMRPSEAHMLCVIDDVPYERITLNLSLRFLSELDPSGLLGKPFLERKLGRMNQYRREHFGSDLYSTCLSALDKPSPISVELELRSRISLLLCEIYKAYAARIALGEEEETQQNRTVARMISYINRNLAEPLSLDVLSRHFFLSKSQLSRLFRQATGTTVWEYITTKRLLAARERIRGGENAGTVAAAVGFREYSTFYRTYKARFGVSPKADAENK